MLRPGQAIACCVIALLTLGVIMVNSADMSLDPTRAISFESILLSRSSAYMVLALFAMAVASWLPLRSWAERVCPTEGAALTGSGGGTRFGAPMLWVGAGAILATLATVYLPLIGKEINGSHRWLEIAVPGVGNVSLQPSEIAKWSLVILIAWYAAYLGRGGEKGLGRFWTGLVPALMAVGAVAGFIVVEDLGTGVLLGAVAALVLVAGGAKIWQMLLLTPLAAGMLVAAVMTSPYRMKRLTAFLDPYSDPEKTGFHMIQSMSAVANGEVFGRGLGHGLQKFGYLPEDRTDFLFAVICEELGVVGAGLVVLLYAAMIGAGFSIIRAERSAFRKLVGFGIIVTVGLQAVINLAVVTGLGPTKGIALPLLSSGGTGWILTAASLGLLVAIDRGIRDDERRFVGDVADERPVAATA